MRIDLMGRSALVTGSGAGIGRAIAAGLHAAGATVTVHDLTPERVEQAIAELGGGERLRGVAADAGTAAGCAELIAAAPDVDVLVNNVGYGQVEDPVWEIPDESWERIYAVNVMSGVRLSRHHVPRMVQRGWGRAIFVASEAGVHVPRQMVHYGVSKAAVMAVARGYAESVPGSGVTVNSVLPGPTRTAATDAVLQQLIDDGVYGAATLDEAAAELLASPGWQSSLIQRWMQPEEVANLVVYLASEQAAAITGTAQRVDGGVVRAVH